MIRDAYVRKALSNCKHFISKIKMASVINAENQFRNKGSIKIKGNTLA